MRIIVCIKQVPDSGEVRFDKETHTMIREGLPSIINPFDENAIEAALQLREEHGGEVIALCMGAPHAEEQLRQSVAMGADQAILLSDRRFALADTLATAYSLSTAIRKIGDYDLLLFGKQAIDGDTAQVGRHGHRDRSCGTADAQSGMAARSEKTVWTDSGYV